MHIIALFLSIFSYNESTLPFIDTVVYAVIPFKDGCIALLLARLYYYQGTSEKRGQKDKDHLYKIKSFR